MIYFRCKRDHCEDILTSNEILTVFELHVYELLKFLQRSITQDDPKQYLNDLLTLRYFSTIDSAVSSKSAEGSFTGIKTHQAVD